MKIDTMNKNYQTKYDRNKKRKKNGKTMLA